MHFIDNHSHTTLEVKKSKFITHIFPYKDFDEVMKKLKNDHPKARHHVYAYRYLNEFDQIVENCSDDGEPKNTSGKPSLAVLAGKELINTAIITVRYFGGIKLGTGGLVKSYGDAVNLAISEANLIKYEKEFLKSLCVDYDILGQIEFILNNLEIKIVNKEFNANITLHLKASEEKLQNLEKKLLEKNYLIPLMDI